MRCLICTLLPSILTNPPRVRVSSNLNICYFRLRIASSGSLYYVLSNSDFSPPLISFSYFYFSFSNSARKALTTSIPLPSMSSKSVSKGFYTIFLARSANLRVFNVSAY